jgi:hypothetical protein
MEISLAGVAAEEEASKKKLQTLLEGTILKVCKLRPRLCLVACLLLVRLPLVFFALRLRSLQGLFLVAFSV